MSDVNLCCAQEGQPEKAREDALAIVPYVVAFWRFGPVLSEGRARIWQTCRSALCTGASLFCFFAKGQEPPLCLAPHTCCAVMGPAQEKLNFPHDSELLSSRKVSSPAPGSATCNQHARVR